MQVGSSFVVFIGNGYAIAHKKDGTIFSFRTSLIIVIAAFVPVVVAGWVFFTFEYEPFPKKMAKTTRGQTKKGNLISIVIPILFLFYSFSIPKFVVLTFFS